MIYEVVNKPKRIETVLLDSAVSFACAYLKLNIDFVLEFETLKKHQCGFCDYDEDEIVVTIAKRLSGKDIIRTLFHELVHVKQYSDGRLKHNKIWEGKLIESDDYENFPWEIEAYELEENMMKVFYSSNQIEIDIGNSK
jgi:hypothetical protein